MQVAHYDLFTKIDKAVQVSTRLIFILYWLVDNFIILRKILFNHVQGPKTGTTRLWFWGTVAAVLLGLI